MHLNDSSEAPKTAEALPEIISFAEKKGYVFVNVSELINDMEKSNGK